MGEPTSTPKRAVLYCIVPEDLANRLHEPLRKHFAQHPGIEAEIEVVVEQRWHGRRARGERRVSSGAAHEGEERRRIRAAEGRRVADRRGPTVLSEPPVALPRKAAAHRERIVFAERLEPSSQQLEDRDSARLVTRFQSGERDVFAELYLRYFDRVYNYLRVALRDTHEAEDLTQQVFTNIFEALPDYERRSQPFRSWLFRIVRNTTISQHRKQGRIEPTDPAEVGRRRDSNGDWHDDAPSDVLQWITDRELLLFVERLPPMQRQVLILRYVLDLDSSEIADILELNPANVRMLQSRAIKFLEDRLRSVGRTPVKGERKRPSRRCERQALVLRGRRFALIRQ